MEMEESESFRNKVFDLYMKCRCGDQEAYEELHNLMKCCEEMVRIVFCLIVMTVIEWWYVYESVL